MFINAEKRIFGRYSRVNKILLMLKNVFSAVIIELISFYNAENLIYGRYNRV